MAIQPNKKRLEKLMSKATQVPRSPNIITVTSNTTLNSEQSGAVILLGGESATTLTLPPVQAGLWFKVFVTNTERHVIAAQTAVMQGNYRHNSAATTIVRVAISDKKTITMAASNRAVGETFEFFSDGVNWYVDGLTNTAIGLGT